MFAWLRSKVRDSILAGVQDALQEIDGDSAAPPVDVLALLRSRLQSLPAPSAAEDHTDNGNGVATRSRNNGRTK
jgi:hypothetical protein